MFAKSAVRVFLSSTALELKAHGDVADDEMRRLQQLAFNFETPMVTRFAM